MGDSSQSETYLSLFAPYRRLLGLVQRLYETELEVLTEVAEGLLQGQDQYGALDLMNDTRDFNREAAQEDRDWLAYRAMAIVRDRKRR